MIDFGHVSVFAKTERTKGSSVGYVSFVFPCNAGFMW